MEPTRPLREFARKCLSVIHRRHPEALVHADVFLEDLNGPKGGQDMSVKVRLRLRNGRMITIREVREDLHAAIALASRRAAFSVRQALEEGRRIDRREGRRARRGGLTDPMEAAAGAL